MSLESRTALYAEHLALGAKMVPFAGYSMPVLYSGIQAEHAAVRRAAGLFDVSHMGKIEVRGPSAREFLQFVTVGDQSRLPRGGVRYSALCREDGGVLDDILVYRQDESVYLLIVNASNQAKVERWLDRHAMPGTEIDSKRDALGILALQGPQAPFILDRVLRGGGDAPAPGSAGPADSRPSALQPFTGGFFEFQGERLWVGRTGYTGEDGFEIYPSAAAAPSLFGALLEAGKGYGILPAGLGARDTLRLEAGLSLYGHELSEEWNPIEAGLQWIVSFDKGDFLGREALRRTAEDGPRRLVVGVELLEKAIPREGYPVLFGGNRIGQITSGTVSPTLGKGIGLALVETAPFAGLPGFDPKALRLQPAKALQGTAVEVMIREQGRSARVVSRYFYRRPEAPKT